MSLVRAIGHVQVAMPPGREAEARRFVRIARDRDANEEYWMPAADLPDFNANIVGPIEVVARLGDAGRAAPTRRAGNG